MTTDAIIQAARTTLRQALALDFPDSWISLQAERWILGQVWNESRFGSTPDWGKSNNWGAVTYWKKDGKFIEHADHSADGKPVSYKFQAYDTQLEAARGYLHIFMRGDVPTALKGTDAKALATAMYKNHYYTGVPTDSDHDGVVGTANDRITDYTNLIERGAYFMRERLAAVEFYTNIDLGTVKGLQEGLTKCGFDPGPIDGILGPKTVAAIEAFQTAKGLTVDGKAGIQTNNAILETIGA